MNRNRNKLVSPQYERSLAAIKRIEAHLKPEIDAWEAEKMTRLRVVLFGKEVLDANESNQFERLWQAPHPAKSG